MYIYVYIYTHAYMQTCTCMFSFLFCLTHLLVYACSFVLVLGYACSPACRPLGVRQMSAAWSRLGVEVG